MKNNIPIPGSKKERLLRFSLEAFCQEGFESIHISELAQQAQVTTGTVYHHFGSKLGLYEVICTEIEQRIVDRMEAVADEYETQTAALKAALTAGINFAYKKQFCRVLGEKHQFLPQPHNKIALFFAQFNPTNELKTDLIIQSSWQILNLKLAENELSLEQAHQLLDWLLVRDSYN